MQAGAAGLDPMLGLLRTPEELNEYLDSFRRKMEIFSYWGYNLAQGIASMTLGHSRPEPWEMFPGWISEKSMTDTEIATNLLAWCG